MVKNKPKSEPQEEMSLLKHLEELRRVIIVSLVAVGIATIGCFFFSDQIMAIFTKPVEDLGYSLYFIGMTEGIFTKLKVSLLAGVVVASPIIFWKIWRFLVPALYPHERKYILKLFPLSVILFGLGVSFAYFAIFPLAVFFLIKLAGDVEPMLTISKFLSFTLCFLIPFGLLFEFPLVVYFLAHIGIISPEFLIKNRKYAIVGTFILAAMLTPGPDPISQLIMAAPMLVLYEVGIFVAKVTSRKRQMKLEELAGDEV
ncbi:MAG: Sec-independent protein translocase protein TatC [Thermoanaerobacterales bacterium 50_218]|nr:MAG: Sec-independent protein translocase protein TatC [Thermoanaerobacterales bacterium 50_218]HAA89510.1 twin-arginine translocase subunit TatC [Peptococcaceae bacterium]